jgi:plastocyanin
MGLTAPSVTVDPSSKSAQNGQKVTFTAEAIGSPQPGAQWQVSSDGGKTWTDVAATKTDTDTANTTSTELTVTANAANNGNLYRCVFTNSQGHANSKNAKLTLATNLEISIEPTSITALVGETVRFTAKALGRPAPKEQWQISTDGGKAFRNIAGATSPTLTLTASTENAGDEYRAIFASSRGSQISQVATLNVNFSPIHIILDLKGMTLPPTATLDSKIDSGGFTELVYDFGGSRHYRFVFKDGSGWDSYSTYQDFKLTSSITMDYNTQWQITGSQRTYYGADGKVDKYEVYENQPGGGFTLTTCLYNDPSFQDSMHPTSKTITEVNADQKVTGQTTVIYSYSEDGELVSETTKKAD